MGRSPERVDQGRLDGREFLRLATEAQRTGTGMTVTRSASGWQTLTKTEQFEVIGEEDQAEIYGSHRV